MDVKNRADDQTDALMRQCPYCSQMILPDSAFCHYCKMDLASGRPLHEIQALRWTALTLRYGINLFVFLPFLLALCYSIITILTTALNEII
ncbi:MAG: hypothetical protein C4527_05855 [Candidatus Omnitrophota bacterium]|jgi:hypothetical protein|nr:MAG: hypothetical protein C4527_05855 [Candidatus Omnitrophota bacterium]